MLGHHHHASAAPRGPYRPFLVADRPNHLNMIRTALGKTSGNIGIMTHARVSETVINDLASWPDRFKDRTTIICDSGAFHAEGPLPLDELFDVYSAMEPDFGIIPDRMGNAGATADIAWDAAARYDSENPDWNLAAVAHGDTPKEYETAYRDLRNLGYHCVALGGLLDTTGSQSGRHATVDDKLLWPTLRRLARYRDRGGEQPWLFALGCGAPRRHARLASLGIFGADDKGWLFDYEASLTREQEIIKALQQNAFSYHKQPGLLAASQEPSSH